MKKNLVVWVLFIMLCGCSNKLDLDSKLVQDLYQQVNPSEDGSILQMLYEDGGLSNQYMLVVAINDYIESQDNQVKVIFKEEVENRVASIFGDDKIVKHEITYLLSNGYCGFEYNDKLEQYELIPGCGGDMYQSFERKIVDAKDVDQQIIITEKSIYIYRDWDADYSHVTIYDNIEKQDKITEFDNNPAEELNVDIDDYLDRASTYEYTFEKGGDHYIFKGVKLVD